MRSVKPSTRVFVGSVQAPLATLLSVSVTDSLTDIVKRAAIQTLFRVSAIGYFFQPSVWNTKASRGTHAFRASANGFFPACPLDTGKRAAVKTHSILVPSARAALNLQGNVPYRGKFPQESQVYYACSLTIERTSLSAC
jgi:hypothetical protein